MLIEIRTAIYIADPQYNDKSFSLSPSRTHIHTRAHTHTSSICESKLASAIMNNTAACVNKWKCNGLKLIQWLVLGLKHTRAFGFFFFFLSQILSTSLFVTT